MNRFQRAAAMHSRAVDGVFGEPVRVEPRRAAGRMTAGAPDPDRPVHERVTATVTASASVVGRRGEGSENGDNAKIVAQRLTVSFDAPLAASLDLRPGDHVVRIEEPGQPVLRLGEPLSIMGRAVFPSERVG